MSNGKNEAVGFLKKFVGFSVATWVGALLSFIVTPIATRVFDTAELGKINLFQTYITLLMYMGLLGLQQGYIRFCKEPPKGFQDKSLYKFCTALSLIFTLIMDIFVIMLWKPISKDISGFENIIVPICLAASTAAYVVMTLTSTRYRMAQNIRGYNIQQIGITFATKISYLLAAIVSPRHDLAIVVMSVCFIAWAIVSLLKQNDTFGEKVPYREKESIRTIILYSLPWILVLFVNYLNTSLPKLLIKSMLDYSSVGIYSSAVSIVSIISLLQAGFNLFWTPYVYENYKQNSDRIQLVHRIISLLMILFGICILLGQDILYMVLGESYRESKCYFGMLLVSPVLYTIGETTGFGINIAKKSYLNIIVSAATIVSNLIISYFLIPYLGCTGAALSVMVSSFVMFVVKTVLGERYYKTVSSKSKTIIGIALFIAATLVSWKLTEMYLVKYAAFVLIGACVLLVYMKEVKMGLVLIKELVAKKRQ